MSKIRNYNESNGSEFELNLAPMLAMMVTLIPILLLSVMFVRVTVIDATIPQILSKAIKKDRENKTPKLSLALSVYHNKNMRLEVTENGGKRYINFKPVESNYDLDKLHETIVTYKQKYPEVFKIEFNPDMKLAYKDIIAVLDEIRSRKKTDPEINLEDKDLNKVVKIDLLFPEIIFANVVEG